MIDMHTHILPGIDNGSGDYGEAERIVDEAKEKGIDTIFLTPHQNAPTSADLKNIMNRFKTFKKWFEKKEIDFYLGGEINYQEGILERIRTGELLTMNGTNYVLLDFLDHPNYEILEAVHTFKKAEYKIIVAHVEYYTQLTIKDIESIKVKGALIQVNAETILDKKHEKWVKQMLKERLIDFIASNIHSSRDKNYMAEAYEFVSKKTNEDYAELIFKRNQKNFLL